MKFIRCGKMPLVNKLTKEFLILVINFYRRFISPLTQSSCRYQPTCSEYALEAIQIHGPFKGIITSLKRILSCHPLGGSGYDPVQNTNKTDKKNG